MFAKGGELNVAGGLAEELRQLLRRLASESFSPVGGGQDDHHAPPLPGHFIGQIEAGDFPLNFVGAVLARSAALTVLSTL
jgi:hypothetical protein